MALTRKMLKAMGIEDEKIEQIIEEHAESTDALKQQRDEARAKAAEADNLRRQLEEAKASGGDNWQAKYEAEHEAFDAFRGKVRAESEEREKRGLYRDLLAKAGVDPRRIDSVLRVADLSKVEVKDGAIQGAEALEQAVRSDWADFIVTKTTEGAPVATPPKVGSSSAVTAEQFARMTLRQRNELYQTDRAAYDALVNTNE